MIISDFSGSWSYNSSRAEVALLPFGLVNVGSPALLAVLCAEYVVVEPFHPESPTRCRLT